MCKQLLIFAMKNYESKLDIYRCWEGYHLELWKNCSKSWPCACGAVQDQNGEEVLLKPIKLVYYGCVMYYRYQFQGRYQVPSYSYTLGFVVYSFYNTFSCACIMTKEHIYQNNKIYWVYYFIQTTWRPQPILLFKMDDLSWLFNKYRAALNMKLWTF